MPRLDWKGDMDPWTDNRLTILGPTREIAAFEFKSNWLVKLGGKHSELYECAARRHVWWFETGPEPPMSEMVVLSKKWPRVTFLLDYENRIDRFKGMGVLRKGQVDSCQIHYRL